MKQFTAITAATFLIACSALVGCDKEKTADSRTVGEKTKDAIASAGDGIGKAVDKTVDAASSAGNKIGDALHATGAKAKATTQPSSDTALKGSRDALAASVEAAVAQNGLNDLIGTFTKADRDRIGRVDNDSLADLNKVVGQFRDDFNAKYGQDFKVSDKERLVLGTPVAIQVGDAAAEARLAAASSSPIDTSKLNGKNDANNLTSAAFPAIGSAAPAVSVSLRNEGSITSSYKLDVPDTVDAAKLKANLIKHLGEVEGMKAQWPSDVNEATRAVSQHILAAITDMNPAQ